MFDKKIKREYKIIKREANQPETYIKFLLGLELIGNLE